MRIDPKFNQEIPSKGKIRSPFISITKKVMDVDINTIEDIDVTKIREDYSMNELAKICVILNIPALRKKNDRILSILEHQDIKDRLIG